MRLPIVSANQVIRALASIGFRISRQSGSHIIMIKRNNGKITVVIPIHNELAK